MGNNGGERRLEKLGFEKEENEPIVKGIRETGREGVDWINLAQDRK